MSMFCYQCQETARNSGCTVRGVCGKQEDTAQLQDLLIYVCKGVSMAADHQYDPEAGRFVTRAQIATITNANFDNERLTRLTTDPKALSRVARKALEIFISSISPMPPYI